MSSPKTHILAFGAHPDDIEFGCGAVIAVETLAKRSAHFVVCSQGEASTNGTPQQRAGESRAAAKILGATIEFVEMGGDCHLEYSPAAAIKIAEFIRRMQPSTVLAPSWVENQHPDHSTVGKLVRDAARMARYGGLEELRELDPWSIERLFYYAVTPDGIPRDVAPIYIDVSKQEAVAAWISAMRAHETQTSTRNYVDLQLTRARTLGAQAGVEHAIALFPNDPLVFESLALAGKGARRF